MNTNDEEEQLKIDEAEKFSERQRRFYKKYGYDCGEPVHPDEEFPEDNEIFDIFTKKPFKPLNECLDDFYKSMGKLMK